MGMFCNQCEQAANGVGCNISGVCGKKPDVAALQDLLLYGLKGIALYAADGTLASTFAASLGPPDTYYGVDAIAVDLDLHVPLADVLVSHHIDRAGNLIGKYRKVYVPRGEIEGGLTPGHDFPVFQTDASLDLS